MRFTTSSVRMLCTFICVNVFGVIPLLVRDVFRQILTHKNIPDTNENENSKTNEKKINCHTSSSCNAKKRFSNASIDDSHSFDFRKHITELSRCFKMMHKQRKHKHRELFFGCYFVVLLFKIHSMKKEMHKKQQRSTDNRRKAKQKRRRNTTEGNQKLTRN